MDERERGLECWTNLEETDESRKIGYCLVVIGKALTVCGPEARFDRDRY